MLEYSEKINIKYSEIDCNLTLKPFYLLNFLQDLASKNAEDMGFGYTFMHPNYMWFLIRYRMEFSEYPIDVQDITLGTEPRGYNKLFTFRDFEFYKEGKCVGRIASQWAIIDTKTRSMVQPAIVFENKDNISSYQKREDDLSFAKIKSITNPDITKEFEVRYDDLDVNGHANNGNYITWAFEPLDYNFRNAHKIKNLDIIYKKEAKYGEKLISEIEYSKETNTTLHRLKNLDNEDLCLLQCEWDKI